MGSGLFVKIMNASIKFTVKCYNLVPTDILYLKFNGYISGMVFSLYFSAQFLTDLRFL